ncbi:MAG: isoaspartyl peptidase/L-asparaginase [Chloroflexi bacterium]|nr:isoaspartyl peptidase/L-asparaginase [Chloroflexota bacterium]
MPITLIVHAGAWEIPDDEVDAHVNACRNALAAGWRLLQAGASAVDAAQAAVVVLEDDPALDAGIGSVLTADGTVELDAGIMRGEDLQCGAVATLTRVRNPIILAREVMHSPQILLTGSGAEAFAVSRGIELVDPSILIVEREQKLYEEWKRGQLKPAQSGEHKHDTVGAVAMDAAGHIVAAVSTGGTAFSPAGRVGDVPQVGCGFYADDAVAGAVCTGHGESISRVVLAKTAVDQVGAGATAAEAARQAIALMTQKVNGTGGIIMIDRDGRPGLAHSTSRMAYGYITAGMPAGTFGVMAP